MLKKYKIKTKYELWAGHYNVNTQLVRTFRKAKKIYEETIKNSHTIYCLVDKFNKDTMRYDIEKLKWNKEETKQGNEVNKYNIGNIGVSK